MSDHEDLLNFDCPSHTTPSTTTFFSPLPPPSPPPSPTFDDSTMAQAVITTSSIPYFPLISTSLHPQVQEALRRSGYTSQVVHFGAKGILPYPWDEGAYPLSARFVLSLVRGWGGMEKAIGGSGLVITHAGADPRLILHCIESGKKVIIVPNPGLATSPTAELCDQLRRMGCILSTTLE